MCENLYSSQNVSVLDNSDDCDHDLGSELSKYPYKIKVFGLDCEWVTRERQGSVPVCPVALLQLAFPNGKCFLIRLCCMNGEIPEKLRDILEDRTCFKVGVGIAEDSKKLCSCYGLVVQGCVDLRHVASRCRAYVQHCLIEEKTRHGMSLSSLSQQVLGVALDKDWRIRCSNWEAGKLTERQIEYAANDAIVAERIFFTLAASKLREREDRLESRCGNDSGSAGGGMVTSGDVALSSSAPASGRYQGIEENGPCVYGRSSSNLYTDHVIEHQATKDPDTPPNSPSIASNEVGMTFLDNRTENRHLSDGNLENERETENRLTELPDESTRQHTVWDSVVPVEKRIFPVPVHGRDENQFSSTADGRGNVQEMENQSTELSGTSTKEHIVAECALSNEEPGFVCDGADKLAGHNESGNEATSLLGSSIRVNVPPGSYNVIHDEGVSPESGSVALGKEGMCSEFVGGRTENVECSLGGVRSSQEIRNQATELPGVSAKEVPGPGSDGANERGILSGLLHKLSSFSLSLVTGNNTKPTSKAKVYDQYPSFKNIRVTQELLASDELWGVLVPLVQGIVDVPYKAKQKNRVSYSEKSGPAGSPRPGKVKGSGLKPRRAPLYQNCVLEAPDGEMLSTCDKRKADWYLVRDLADVVNEEPYTIRLRFEPAGRPMDPEHNYYLTFKENVCVVCGRDDCYMRKNIIPHDYRKHFPPCMKNHHSHDVLLLCPPCHMISCNHDDMLRKRLAAEYCAPLASSQVARIVQDPVLKKVKSAAKALVYGGENIPEKRRQELLSTVKDFLPGDENPSHEMLVKAADMEVRRENCDFISHGREVVCKVKEAGELLSFEKMWREHFLAAMKPRYLPPLWAVDHEQEKVKLLLEQELQEEENSEES